jgi:hypothetical protein
MLKLLQKTTACSDKSTGTNPELSAAPTLPDTEQINFVNAYWRTVVLIMFA